MTDPDHHKPLASADLSSAKGTFDANQTHVFQARMRYAPQWWCSFLASNSREKNRMRAALGKIRGAAMLRAASTVSPYLLIWVVPGSILILPFLAWRLDARRKHRERKAAKLAK